MIIRPFDEVEEMASGNIKGDNRFLEKISRMVPHSFTEIQDLQRKGNFQCGVSSAALFQFGCYMPEFYKSA